MEERGRRHGWEGCGAEEERTREGSTAALGLEPGRLQGPEEAELPYQLDVKWVSHSSSWVGT